MRLIILSVIALPILANSQVLPELDPSWFEERRKMLANLDELPKELRIQKLAPLVGMGAQVAHSSQLDPSRFEIFHAARQALLKQPGYGDYFVNRLTGGRDQIDQFKQTGELGRLASAWVKFNREQNNAWDTLSQLPGPETVRVLGELLNDERGHYATPREAFENGNQETAEASNSEIALRALQGLSLASKPVPSRPYNKIDYDSDRHSWLLWYAQVKAGTRTFRFEGDPQEYNLNGPVNSPSHYRSNRTSLAANSPAHGMGQQSAVASVPKALPIAATLVGLLAGWFAWRAARSAKMPK